MNHLPKIFFWVVVVVAAYGALRMLKSPAYDYSPPPQPGSEESATEETYNVERFAELPVVADGRIKPIGTLARNTLILTRQKQTALMMVPSEDNPEEMEENKIPAPVWAMDALLNPRAAGEYKIFRIDNSDVVSQLGLGATEENEFSFMDLQPAFATLEEKAKVAADKADQLRTEEEKALLRLHRAAGTFLQLTHTLHNPSLPGQVTEALEALKQARANAIMAVRQSASPEAISGNSPEMMRLQAFFEAFHRFAHHPVLPVPPAEGEAKSLADESGAPIGWETMGHALVGESVLDMVKKDQIDPIAYAYGELIDAYQAGDVLKFNNTLERLHTLIAARAPGYESTVHFEEFFNVASPFANAAALYVLAFLVICGSWLALSAGKPDYFHSLMRAAFWVMVIAFVVHTFGLAARIHIQDRPPVTNLYSSAVFIGWFAVLLSLIFSRAFRNGIGLLAASALGFCTLVIAHNLALSSGGDTLEMMQAVLDSNFWLSTHVVAITIGYSAVFLAGFLALLFLILGIFTKLITKDTSRTLSGMVYGVTCFALLFSFVGTVLGGIWADQSWGRFWGWDPKENGALMIVLWTALILHARWGGVAKKRGIMSLAVLGNCVTAWSWFGTNMLGVGLHSYGFTGKAFMYLSLFCISQVAVVLLAYSIPKERWRSPFAGMSDREAKAAGYPDDYGVEPPPLPELGAANSRG